MKKYLFLSLLSFASFFSASAQCTPNPVAVLAGLPGPYPTTVQGLPDGNISVAYSETVTMIVPNDTTIDFSAFYPGAPTVSAHVNYWKINTITGMPAGITYTCDASACNWTGGTNGCFLVSGTPTAGGNFTVAAATSLNVVLPGSIPIVGGTSQSLPVPLNFPLKIVGTTDLGDALNPNSFAIAQNFPNPGSASTLIRFSSPEPAITKLRIMNQVGAEVFTTSLQAHSGINEYKLDLQQLNAGVYFYNIESANSITRTMKMAVLR